MTRLYCLALAGILANAFPIHAQDKEPARQDPPKEFTNCLGMKFVWIPPGNFMMGSRKGEEGRSENEIQHRVTLTKGLYVGAYLVTQEQWQEIMGANASVFRGAKNLPVEMVSWHECQGFVNKLREKDRKLYRLPTEAEWEYCCRAGTKTPFSFGETISAEQANYNGNLTYGKGVVGFTRAKTTPVGTFPANAWGLYDMHGNVWEWCQDWYGDYPEKDVVDPQGPDKGESRVLRGGSWVFDPTRCRSAFRFQFVPAYRNFNIGFRVVCFPEEGPISVVTYLDTNPAWGKEAMAALEAYRAATREEAGAIRVDVYQEIGRPGRFVIDEVWKDFAASDAHAKSSKLAYALEPGLLAPPDIRPHTDWSVAGPRKALGAKELYAFTHVDVKPPNFAALEAMLRPYVEKSRDDKGVLRLDVLQNLPDERNHLTLAETWASEADFLAHQESAHARAFRDQLGPLLASLYDQRVYHLVK